MGDTAILQADGETRLRHVLDGRGEEALVIRLMPCDAEKSSALALRPTSRPRAQASARPRIVANSSVERPITLKTICRGERRAPTATGPDRPEQHHADREAVL